MRISSNFLNIDLFKMTYMDPPDLLSFSLKSYCRVLYKEYNCCMGKKRGNFALIRIVRFVFLFAFCLCSLLLSKIHNQIHSTTFFAHNATTKTSLHDEMLERLMMLDCNDYWYWKLELHKVVYRWPACHIRWTKLIIFSFVAIYVVLCSIIWI